MPDLQRLFQARMREIHALQEVQQLLEWDQEVVMPPGACAQRAGQVAALAGLTHRLLVAPELGETLAALTADGDLGEDLLADVRETLRQRDRALRVPEALVSARTEACALAQGVWVEARLTDDFARFRPSLERVVDLTRETAAALEGDNPYDALLDEYEPGMTEATLQTLFAGLQRRLPALIQAVGETSRPADPNVLRRPCPRSAQEAFGRKLLNDLGYDFSAGRLDVSAHPMTSGTFSDVRITTRYHENYLNTAIFGILHEGGHALYEQGLDPERYRDPAGGFCSMGIHESQSRLWENQIGRSQAFWRHYLPVLRETCPGTFDDVSVEDFHRAVNACTPSLIRVEADEITYNLHVILRFELESALIGGRLAPADLPDAWQEGMRRLLGIAPPSDRDGVLQDIHWSMGAFGYFPTYTLGNLYAAQFMRALQRDLPDWEGRIGRVAFGDLREWLRSKIHRLGRKYPAEELCRRVTGESLSVEPFISYLEEKYGDLFG